jgi:class 3 adenylate cyclase
VEAAVSQLALGSDPDRIKSMLVAAARYLAAHAPTVRAQDQTFQIAHRLAQGDRLFEDVETMVTTVLFTDIVDSTKRASELGDRRWRDLVERHNEAVREELRRFGGRELSTTGDGFVATFDRPTRAIKCATAIVESLARIDVDVRAGLHTGECEVRDGVAAGLAFHVGARVVAQAGPREVLLTSTVRDLVAGSGVALVGRGPADLKGVSGQVDIYAVKA